MFRTSRMLSDLHGADDFPDFTPDIMPSTPFKQTTSLSGKAYRRQMSPVGTRTDTRPPQSNSPKLFSARFVSTNIATRPDVGATSSQPSWDGPRLPEKTMGQAGIPLRSQHSSVGMGGLNPTKQYQVNASIMSDANLKAAAGTAVPKQTPRNTPYGTSSFAEKTPTSNLTRQKSIHKEVTFTEQPIPRSQQAYETENSFATSESPMQQLEAGAGLNFRKTDYPSTQQYISMSNGRFEQLLNNSGERSHDFILKQYLESFEPQARALDRDLHSSQTIPPNRAADESDKVNADGTERKPQNVKKVSNDHSQHILNKLMEILQRREMQEVKRRKRRLDAKTFANFMEMMDDEELQQKLTANKYKAQQKDDSNSPLRVMESTDTAQRAAEITPKKRQSPLLKFDSTLSKAHVLRPKLSSHSTIGHQATAANSSRNLTESGTQTVVDNPVVCLRFRIAKSKNIEALDDVQTEASDLGPSSSGEETHQKSRKRHRHHGEPLRSEVDIKGNTKKPIFPSNGGVTQRFGFHPLNNMIQEHQSPHDLSKKHRPRENEKRHSHSVLRPPRSSYAENVGELNNPKTDSDDEIIATSDNFPSYHDPHSPVQAIQQQRTIHHHVLPRHHSAVKIVETPPILVKARENSHSPERNLYEIVVQLEVDKENETKTRDRPVEKVGAHFGNKNIGNNVRTPNPVSRRRVKSERYSTEKSEEETRVGSSSSQNMPPRHEVPVGAKPKAQIRYSKEANANVPLMPAARTAAVTPGVLGIGAPRLLGVYYNLTSDTKPEVKHSKISNFGGPANTNGWQQSQHLLSIAEREAVRSFQPPAVKLLIDSREKHPVKRASKYKQQTSTSSETDEQRASYISASQHVSDTSLESDEAPAKFPPKRPKPRMPTKSATALKQSVVKPKTIRFSPDSTTDEQHQRNMHSELTDVVSTFSMKNKQQLSAGMQPQGVFVKRSQSQLHAAATPQKPLSQVEEENHATSTTTSEDQQQQAGASESDQRNIANSPRHKKKLSATSVYERLPPKRSKSRHHTMITPVVTQSVNDGQMRSGLVSMVHGPRRQYLPPRSETRSQASSLRKATFPRSDESQRFSVVGTKPTESSTQESTDKSSAANDSIKGIVDVAKISVLTKEAVGNTNVGKRSSDSGNAVYADEGMDYGNDEGKSLVMMTEIDGIGLNEQETVSEESKKSLISRSSLDLPAPGNAKSNTEETNPETDGSSENDNGNASPDSFVKGSTQIKSETSRRSEKLSDIEEVVSIVADLVSNLGPTELEEVDLKGEEFLSYIKAAVDDVKRSRSQLQVSDRAQSTEKSSSSRSLLTSSGVKSKLSIREIGDSQHSEPET